MGYACAMSPSGKKLSGSQTRWLQRDRRDAYVRAAAQEGFRSRSAYKLLDIDARFKLLHKGSRVVDLGAAPGGWSQVAAKRVGAGEGREWVVGIDPLEIAPLPGCHFLRTEFPAPELREQLLALLGGRVNLVLSDMLANMSGNRLVDFQGSLNLCQQAEAFAAEILAPKGALCCKLLRGGDGSEEKEMLEDWKTRFERVERFKPKASRGESAEIYLVALGFRGSSLT